MMAEGRTRNMRLADVLPNMRCENIGNVTYVEIPYRWKSIIRRDDPDVASLMIESIKTLIIKHGKKTPVLDEFGRSNSGMILGWIVPVTHWDRMAAQDVPGYKWKDFPRDE